MKRPTFLALMLVTLGACGGGEDADTVDAATTTRLQGTVTYQGPAQGSLILAVFTSFPPAGAPAGLAQEASPTFPATLTIDALEPGTLHVLALLDVDPASPQQPGPEDITAWKMDVAAEAGTVTEISIALQDP